MGTKKIILGYLGFIIGFILLFVVVGLCASFAAWDWGMFTKMTDVFTSSFGLRFLFIFSTIVYSIIVVIFKKW